MNLKYLVFAVTAASLLGCSGDDGPTQPGDGGGSTISVTNNAFTPATLNVAANTTVTWVWNSSGIEHNVTFQSEPSSVNRGSGSFARPFPAAGSFSYVCTIHAGMSGVVNVAAASGGTGAGGGGGGAYP